MEDTSHTNSLLWDIILPEEISALRRLGKTTLASLLEDQLFERIDKLPIEAIGSPVKVPNIIE
jgi:predicted AAA+ superfamily ATPase